MSELRMTYDEIDQLFLMKHRKKINNKICAAAIGCSGMAISRFFNHDLILSADRQEELKNFIENYPIYQTIKILTK